MDATKTHSFFEILRRQRLRIYFQLDTLLDMRLPVAGLVGEGFFLVAPAKPRPPRAMQVVADWLIQAFGASPDPKV